MVFAEVCRLLVLAIALVDAGLDPSLESDKEFADVEVERRPDEVRLPALASVSDAVPGDAT